MRRPTITVPIARRLIMRPRPRSMSSAIVTVMRCRTPAK
jgi:hypothetical protein